jgi:hypothetical protein
MVGSLGLRDTETVKSLINQTVETSDSHCIAAPAFERGQQSAGPQIKGDFRMTRLSLTIMLAGTAVALLATTPGRATDAFNGISPNGISPNGISPNGISPNGVSPNGVSPNGVSRNGFVGGMHSANAAGEIGSVIAIELPR